MGIYEDIAGSAAPRGSGAFITPGDYLVTLLANRQFKSNKPGNPETFVVEAKVDEVLFALEADGKSKASNRKGEQLSWIKTLKGEYVDSVMSDIKAYVAAVIGVEIGEVTGPMIAKAFENDGKDFAGLPMKIHAVDKPTRSGGVFTVVTWSQPTAGELALLNAPAPAADEIPLG